MSVIPSTSFGVALAAGVTLLARASVLLVGATPLLALVSPAHAASDKLYWSDAASSGGIRRMDVDGMNLEWLPTSTSGARGLEIDRVHERMYWFNAGTDDIRSARLDGTDAQVVASGVHESYGAVVDPVAGRIYWCATNSSVPSAAIEMANLDGTNRQPFVSMGLVEPVGIALDVRNGWIYWSDVSLQKIERIRTNGADRQVIAQPLGGLVYAMTVDQDTGTLYWSVVPQPVAATGSIWRWQPGGSGPAPIFSNLVSPTAIVPGPANGFLTWTESYDQQNPRIVRGDIATGATIVIHSGSGVPWGLALLRDFACGPDPSTLEHFRFDEGLANQAAAGAGTVLGVPGAVHGTPSGGPIYRTEVAHVIVPQTGAVNVHSLELDGVDDEVSFPEPFLFSRSLAEATFEIYLKLPDQQHGAITWGSGPDCNYFHLYVSPGGVLGMNYRDASCGLHELLPGNGTYTITPNTWTHVAVTRRAVGGSHTYEFFKDGTSVYTAIDSSPNLPTSQVWTLSGRPTPGNHVRGLVDEIRFSDLVLSPNEFLRAPFDDVNGNAIPDTCECTTANYCIAGVNSLGYGAHMDHGGAPSLGMGSMSIQCVGCPPNATGLFFYGPGQVQVPFGNGYRCVGGPIRRLGVTTASAMGIAARTLDYSLLPPGATITAGSTWNFQFWYRNVAGGGQGFNLSDGLSIRFCP